ncbi:hypothetical protein [Nocardia arthritidis]|uniref:Uncharacterized protein n=1 Tax=Nocardia arthritidis TaxID=228602 RepID=A0A6G9Y570_9NOCA|nr:hypothetical protein [Nocardia arthritidis]QIS08216.1 hypothetical protein F5544_01465 [Nocardia arthritidis]
MTSEYADRVPAASTIRKWSTLTRLGAMLDNAGDREHARRFAQWFEARYGFTAVIPPWSAETTGIADETEPEASTVLIESDQ